jgi:LPXTG-site transpeptidase (sortase) family protein
MRIRQTVRPLAWTLLACVLLTAGWAVYMVTDPFAGHRQQTLQEHLYQQWRAPAAPAQPAPARAGPAGMRKAPAGTARAGTTGARTTKAGTTGVRTTTAGTTGARTTTAGVTGSQLRPDRIRPVTGQPFALIRVPAFGRNWQFAIVEGTALSQLALGPGHVAGTGLPGQPGNFVVAAHDVTAGNPFLHLRALRYPDKVYVYTRSRVYEYEVRSERITRYTNVGVEYPVPGHPGVAPHRSLITLITCTPVTLAFTPWRIVVTGELVSVSARK